MPIYIRNNLIYNFNRQGRFKPRYMSKNTRSSQRYKRYDKNSISRRGLSLVKDKWDKNLLVVFLLLRGKVYESIYFLLYDYLAVKWE